MAYQSMFNGYAAFKVQSGLGTAASGSGATVLRQAGGQGGRATKATVESNEVRRDGMRQRGRHGTQSVTASWETELSLGTQERLMEAIIRGTFASDLVITEATASLTSITTTTSTIVAGAGSWITAGLKVGDVIQLTGHTTAGNNSRNLRITGLTTSTITVAETLTLNAIPDTAFTITVPKKLICPTAANRLERYFTVEEYFGDLDSSIYYEDAKWSSIRLAMAANGLVNATVGLTGTGKATQVTGGSAPYFTSPTEATAIPLSVADATIRVNGTDLVELTAFEITIDNGASTVPVFGSGGIKYSPDVFTGQLGINMSFTALRKDMQRMTDFLAETVYSAELLFVENESEPKDFISLFIPNFTLGDVNRAALSRQGGPLTETITIPVGLVGIDNTGGAFESTMVNIQSTGA